MKFRNLLAGLYLVALSAAGWGGEKPMSDEKQMAYGTATWPRERGNHRVLVHVKEAADAVVARIPWRRRDPAPAEIALWVFDAASTERLTNVAPLKVEREEGAIAFEPATVPGDYEIYLMPCEIVGNWYCPQTKYAAPEKTADAAWLEKAGLAGDDALEKSRKLPEAEVLEFQSRSDFHRFDPMEVVATKAEVDALLAAHPERDYLVFPEDRRFPIRMREFLPKRWAETGPAERFEGEALANEYYAFQLGVWAARQDLENVTVEFEPLKSQDGTATIGSSAFDCLNLSGTDWLGRSMERTVNVAQGAVQPLWIGVDISGDARPDTFQGVLTVRVANAEPTRIALTLRVADAAPLRDRGDSELWRHSRLRWLNSTVGLENSPTAPYTPLETSDSEIGCLGRKVTFNPSGLPESIRSYFGENVDRLVETAREVLAEPVRLVAVVEGGDSNGVEWTGNGARVESVGSGVARWFAESSSDGGLRLQTVGRMEYDGFLDVRLTITAEKALDLQDVRLEMPVRDDVAKFMMGLGREGGLRPESWDWQWDMHYANQVIWLGDVNAGLQCKLRAHDDYWDLYGLTEESMPRSWYNEGRGGCRVREQGDHVLFSAFTGPLGLEEGESRELRFSLLVTPLKTLDPGHWNWRYFHEDPTGRVQEAADAGATIINVHHATPINPFINYPFVVQDRLREMVDKVHDAGMKMKLYYTVRELSVWTEELWALRSLGNEIFRNGPGFVLADHFEDEGGGEGDTEKQDPRIAPGHPWLCEHLVKDYVPAWHTPLEGGAMWDISIATQGLSRWHNYYLEGLGWLAREIGIDGIYLDGIGYDRLIMQRVRRVLDANRPGSLIDFHSGNNFAPQYGLGNVLNQYMEHLPYIDSLWIGEGFDYEAKPPDYWLVEISGIPFGLYSEMLHGGGNPWRGMLYGMTNRLPWAGDPRPVWKVWDDFGIEEAHLMGYWSEACPVRTGNDRVPATVYRRDGRALVSIGSWAEEPVEVTLDIDWDVLGVDPDKALLSAPAVENFQEARVFAAGEAIPVEPARGWLLVVSEKGE